MNNKITLENTIVSFTPSFLGDGWETSLLPKTEREYQEDFRVRFSFNWLRKMLLKMHDFRQGWEVRQWTSVIARLFL